MDFRVLEAGHGAQQGRSTYAYQKTVIVWTIIVPCAHRHPRYLLVPTYQVPGHKVMSNVMLEYWQTNDPYIFVSRFSKHLFAL